MAVLVTGASGGLGRWLASVAFPGSHRYSRTESKPDQTVPAEGYELIIHTAQGARPAEGQTDEAFIAAHLDLTRKLLGIPHRRFVYISSVDALEANPTSPYARSKQAVENLLASYPTATIIRPAALFGPGMRHNASLRMVLNPEKPLTLAATSRFAFTGYADVAEAIIHAQKLPTSFNLASLPPYSLEEAAHDLQVNPVFGSYTYTTPVFETDPTVLQHIPALNQSALARLNHFIRNQGYQA